MNVCVGCEYFLQIMPILCVLDSEVLNSSVLLNGQGISWLYQYILLHSLHTVKPDFYLHLYR